MLYFNKKPIQAPLCDACKAGGLYPPPCDNAGCVNRRIMSDVRGDCGCPLGRVHTGNCRHYPRQSGRSTRLLQSMRPGQIFVVPFAHMMDSHLSLARKVGLPLGWRDITYVSLYRSTVRGHRPSDLVLDHTVYEHFSRADLVQAGYLDVPRSHVSDK